jgi:basic membrane protein A
MRKQLFRLMVLLLVLSILAIGCTSEEGSEEGEASEQAFKLAAIFPGVITDADYNALGYLATTAVQTDLGIEVAYSESVAVPDVERVMREYIDDGFNSRLRR